MISIVQTVTNSTLTIPSVTISVVSTNVLTQFAFIKTAQTTAVIAVPIVVINATISSSALCVLYGTVTNSTVTPLSYQLNFSLVNVTAQFVI